VVFLSRPEAVAAAFPDADRVDERSYALDDRQARQVENRSGARLDSRLVTLYTGYRDGEVMGYALIDVHTVRTQPEAFMVVISPEGQVRDVRMLAFYEPQEYLPSERWLKQFRDEGLSPDLSLRRKVHAIAGSTLSSRAVTGGVRRALALYEVLVRDAGRAAAPPPTSGSGGGLGR
jgi:Na+-translocating ferredoxin:NAD+ oxidoreductase RnfG subunit